MEMIQKSESKFLIDYIKDNKEAIKELEILNSIDKNMLKIELEKIGINIKYTAVLNLLFPGDKQNSINLCLKLYCGVNKNNEGISYYIDLEGMNDFGQSLDTIKTIIINSIPNEKVDDYIYFMINKEHAEIVRKIEKHNEKMKAHFAILKRGEEQINDNEETQKMKNLIAYSSIGYQKIKRKNT